MEDLIEIGVAYLDEETGEVYLDDADEIGAIGDGRRRRVARRQSRRSSRRSRRSARRSSRGGGSSSSQVKVRSGVLGLGSATVAASSTGTLDATAQEPCYLQRLLLDGDTSDFTLSDIKVGSKSIYSGTEAVPSGMFRPDATGAPFSMKKRMRVGQTVTVSISNTNSGASKTLSGAFKTIEQAA